MAEPLWTLRAFSKAIGALCGTDPATPVTGVSIDSRTLLPDEAFFAIRGDRQDGHAHVIAALTAGAACAVVAKDYSGAGDERLLRVPDTLEALNALGRASRDRSRGAVIAVTGSVGKTGTKEALRVAFAALGTVYASDKSYNNHWGVPLSLANLPRWSRFGVFEVGMNHPGEIVPLTKLIRPHIAVITTVEPVHLGHFSSVDEIADAKAEIFEGLEPDGTAILNRDNPHFEHLAGKAREAGAGRIVGFGEHAEAEARLLSVELDPEGSNVTANILGDRVSYRIGAPGRHVVQNSLAVLATIAVADGGVRDAASTLAGMHAPKGRGERVIVVVPDGRVALIDESYNANPASMRAALALLGQMRRDEFPRRIAVLGDMLELGETAPDLHRGLNEAVDAAGVDSVFACGPHMAALYEALPDRVRGAYAPTAEELGPNLLGEVRSGDVVMIKGSLGSRMGPLVEALKRHLAGREG